MKFSIWSLFFFPTFFLIFGAFGFLKNGSIGIAIFMVFLAGVYFTFFKLWITSRVDTDLKKLDAVLDYRYKNYLGIDSKSGRVFALGILLDKSEIRSVEKSSIMETKSNACGSQFHKDKHCSLIIHTRSLAQPILTVPFDSKAEMDEWYARLGVFCNLS